MTCPDGAATPAAGRALIRGRAGAARLVARARGLAGHDDGNALVEFLGAALVLMIPTLYLVLTLGRVQAAAFAAQGAAKDAGRALSIAETADAGLDRARSAVAIALADQGFDDADPATALTIACSAVCLAPGSEIATTVRIDVTFPGLGGGPGAWLPLSIPVSAHVVTPVDEYKEAPR
ncbi:hypothetical protein SAMN05216410_1954 [Sanguibacter gelidistatuariae]|uniref:TadE-like protein n=1 Tax=Sanguibacter gelidistatuariae TaxID=1814289 RepID=A0A1G6MS33_9MICO|nr:pilus assembly protein [Sanguibacter gelidistatuariae]SDC58360.1 hypothetical protein SAMN05216410_1954 [Sanguibacter gelidistatuariae]